MKKKYYFPVAIGVAVLGILGGWFCRGYFEPKESLFTNDGVIGTVCKYVDSSNRHDVEGMREVCYIPNGDADDVIVEPNDSEWMISDFESESLDEKYYEDDYFYQQYINENGIPRDIKKVTIWYREKKEGDTWEVPVSCDFIMLQSEKDQRWLILDGGTV